VKDLRLHQCKHHCALFLLLLLRLLVLFPLHHLVIHFHHYQPLEKHILF
jgi:hypothetical protein